MAVLDSGGSFGLRPLVATAEGVAATYAALQYRPGDGNRFPSRAVQLEINVSSSTADLVDVQVQVATDKAFTAITYSNTLVGLGNGIATVMLSALVDKTQYYWRVCAASTGTTGWSAWSPVWGFVPDVDSGKAFGFSNVNIGAQATMVPNSTALSQMNVGYLPVPVAAWAHAVNENVGIEITRLPHAVMHGEEGDVSTHTPVPHLWWISPPAGRSGDGMRIFGFGLGDLSSTYGAVVEINYGGTRGWQAIQTVSWQTYPATPAAYTAARMIDPAGEIIDVQHQVVEITVPDGAIPPGYPIRIRTEGP